MTMQKFIIQKEQMKTRKELIFYFIETFYHTIMPFCLGIFLIKYQSLFFLFFMVLPLYFRLDFQIKNNEEVTVKLK